MGRGRGRPSASNPPWGSLEGFGADGRGFGGVSLWGVGGGNPWCRAREWSIELQRRRARG